MVSKQDIRNRIKDFSGRIINAFEALTSFVVAHEVSIELLQR